MSSRCLGNNTAILSSSGTTSSPLPVLKGPRVAACAPCSALAFLTGNFEPGQMQRLGSDSTQVSPHQQQSKQSWLQPRIKQCKFVKLSELNVTGFSSSVRPRNRRILRALRCTLVRKGADGRDRLQQAVKDEARVVPTSRWSTRRPVQLRLDHFRRLSKLVGYVPPARGCLCSLKPEMDPLPRKVAAGSTSNAGMQRRKPAEAVFRKVRWDGIAKSAEAAQDC